MAGTSIFASKKKRVPPRNRGKKNRRSNRDPNGPRQKSGEKKGKYTRLVKEKKREKPVHLFSPRFGVIQENAQDIAAPKTLFWE